MTQYAQFLSKKVFLKKEEKGRIDEWMTDSNLKKMKQIKEKNKTKNE